MKFTLAEPLLNLHRKSKNLFLVNQNIHDQCIQDYWVSTLLNQNLAYSIRPVYPDSQMNDSYQSESIRNQNW